MKKVVLKEKNNKFLGVDIVLYALFTFIGYILLNLESTELVNLSLTEYTYTLFYVFGFFSLFAYFANRVEDDYEFLIFGFINVCVGTFIMIYSNYPDAGFILADAVLIYSIANVINKGYACKRLLEKKSINFFPKAAITIMLLFLGVFVVSALYSKVEVGTIILGYYFVIFGLLSLLEPLIGIIGKNAKVEKYILNMVSYSLDEKKEEVKKEETKEEKKEVKEEEKVTTKEKNTKKKKTKKTSK